jgi:hypothetical protein
VKQAIGERTTKAGSFLTIQNEMTPNAEQGQKTVAFPAQSRYDHCGGRVAAQWSAAFPLKLSDD